MPPKPEQKARKITHPSASIVVLSPTNQVLLLHRVRHSRSFPSAHVFPGGNLSPFHEGDVPGPDDPQRHVDSLAYRLAAIRETFEESGILLAKPIAAAGKDEALLDVPEQERQRGRAAVHAETLRFEEWVRGVGGAPDVDGLVPFTRWVTPTNMPKRFTTQMYLYLMPLSATTSVGTGGGEEVVQHVPSSDGGLEHTAAEFEDAAAWLGRARRNEIIVFPPQMYLLSLVARFTSSTATDYAAQREKLLAFVTRPDPATGKFDASGKTGKIPWGEKVMSPRMLFTMRDGRQALAVDGPGPELKSSGRGGDGSRIVLVRFKKEGPRDVEIRGRAEVMEAYRAEQAEEEGEKGAKL
ncbi:uncharacterized protein E0L32_003970 [Thyridium curvatum]|uniref:Nudix hydrolase domain-containing protein n=1 Tax=Thyridium curvatum TaxID=1093900 RepID=A0A507BH44_9PEZI|nr:uncharacterized protein E0L32_003970 [Thyridium curvatum]TPX16321.1 hypothetical protein E0L32_003970 [Thyridium curvatum]